MSFPEALANAIYRHRLAASALIVVGALAFAPAADLTNIDNDLTAWISTDDPAYQDYNRFRKEFGGTRSLIIALEGDGLFSPPALQYIDRISRELLHVDRVDRVQSLATASIVRPIPASADDDGGIDVTPLFDDNDQTDEGAARVKREALDDPLLRGDLVSEDARVTAVVVTFDEDRIDEVRGQVLAAIREVVERDRPAGIEAHYNGSLEISEAYNRVTVANTQDLTPPILIITLVALYWMFRSVRKTLLIFVAIGVSVLWTLGLYTAMGFAFNILTSMLTPLVVVLAIADDVHIVQHFDHELRLTGSKERAFKSAVRHLFVPLLGASGTTALGMLSLATSDVVAVRTFGIGAAIGVMVDFAISLIFVPTLLTLVRPDAAPPPQERWLMGPLQKIGRFSFGHPVLIISVVAATAVLAAVGITRLRVDTNHINFFADDHPLSRSAGVVDRQLSGIYSFNILLEGPPDSLSDPDILSRMERLQAQLSQLPYVRKVTSVADYVKRVNQQLSGGADDAYRLPETQAGIAQELFVFGLSDEGRAELSRVVASDYSRAHIAVKLASMSSDLVFEQINQAEQLAGQVFAGTAVRPTVTGSGRIFSTLDHYLVMSQLSSFGTAFLTVFAVIFVVFRSARFGFLGIVANAFPVIAVLGIMGWLDISLNVATVMVASVALGIVDDDTIHFIGRYRREVASGAGTLQAVELASMHEGRAALTTTVINALGYTVLMVSEYRPTAWFGSLLAVTMVLAFITEVFLVPAIIALLPRVFGAPALVNRMGREGVKGVWLALFAGAVIVSLPSPAAAQGVDGYASIFVDALPDVEFSPGQRRAVSEMRSRLFAERSLQVSEHLWLTASGFVEGLIADRGAGSTTRAGIVRPQELHVEARWQRADLRVGLSRVVWGRLDEFQPTDVVNPQDIARFFFEGRSEGRMPVAMIRGRLLPSDNFTVEAIYVPVFRRGRFDQLDEPTSPFNLVPLLPTVSDEPPRTLVNAQGGLRASVTTGRVDWSISTYRGFEPLPVYSFDGVSLREEFPRYTMVGGDFETVSGPWGLRGEIAVFDGDSVEGGVGIDCKAGAYRVSTNVVVTRQAASAATTGDRTDATIVASLDRSFSRETRSLRAFAVYNPGEQSAFMRVIAAFNLRDNVSFEASGGWFTGSGDDSLSRLATRDFVSARLKVFF